MYAMSGIADESGASLDVQLKAHKELGWTWIEMRNCDGKQFHDMDPADFPAARAKFEAAGVKVSCFASALANWATKITDPFENDQAILARSVPMMRGLGCRMIRVMSWPNNGLSQEDWRKEAVRRMKELAATAAGEGITLLLENCDGYASQTPETFASFLAEVDSPALKAVYDTGNPAAHGDADPWPWYLAAKPRLAHIHIKDHTGPRGGDDKGAFTMPGDGAGRIFDTLKDAFASGYDGHMAIEPHIKLIVHTGESAPDAEAMYRSYLEYGRRATKLAADAYQAAKGK